MSATKIERELGCKMSVPDGARIRHNAIHRILVTRHLDVTINWRFWGVAVSWGDTIDWCDRMTSVWFVGLQLGPFVVVAKWRKGWRT